MKGRESIDCVRGLVSHDVFFLKEDSVRGKITEEENSSVRKVVCSQGEKDNTVGECRDGQEFIHVSRVS